MELRGNGKHGDSSAVKSDRILRARDTIQSVADTARSDRTHIKRSAVWYTAVIPTSCTEFPVRDRKIPWERVSEQLACR